MIERATSTIRRQINRTSDPSFRRLTDRDSMRSDGSPPADFLVSKTTSAETWSNMIN